MKGNFFDSKAEITCEGFPAPVATIDRQKWNLRDMVGGQQTYAVTVAPGVDMTLIAAMCVALDERQND